MPRKTNTATADKKALPQFSSELLEKLVPAPITLNRTGFHGGQLS
jgi:hypothetical protein